MVPQPQGDEYYFSDVPNLNRMVIDKKGVVQPSAVREELERRIKRELGTSLRCYPWPRASEDVPDNHDLKLAVLDPDEPYTPEMLEGWLSGRGADSGCTRTPSFSPSPDPDRHARFVDGVKEYLALQEIQEEIRTDDRPGMVEKRGEVKRRISEFEDDVPLKVREMYRTAAVPRARRQTRTGRPRPASHRERELGLLVPQGALGSNEGQNPDTAPE